MTNPSKRRGTRFETDVARHMRARLDDGRIERRAPSGARDMGDLKGIFAHGFHGIAECKSHKGVTPALVERWREQTLAERGNADADFALLVVRVPHVPVGRSRVHVTLEDLELLKPDGRGRYEGRFRDAWASMTLDECCDLIKGVPSE